MIEDASVERTKTGNHQAKLHEETVKVLYLPASQCKRTADGNNHHNNDSMYNNDCKDRNIEARGNGPCVQVEAVKSNDTKMKTVTFGWVGPSTACARRW